MYEMHPALSLKIGCDIFLVDSLDYNLLSVSQLCKMGCNCLFTDVGVMSLEEVMIQ
jgi:hypothetical protein